LYSRLWLHASIPDLAKSHKPLPLRPSPARCSACWRCRQAADDHSVPISVAILDSFLTITVVATPRLLIRGLGTLQHLARTATRGGP